MNPNYVPEPIYPEYIPLEDDHEFPAEEQPLPPIDSPTTESPGYVTESDPEEDPEEYEDDEHKRDDAKDEHEDVDERRMWRSRRRRTHLAQLDSTTDYHPTLDFHIPFSREEAKLRDFCMIHPSPSLPISLSPPSAGEFLARCMAPPAHSPPLPPSSGLSFLLLEMFASADSIIMSFPAAVQAGYSADYVPAGVQV
ncbi:hypothetical protein Tco_1043424 [Tanacetum coccineum]|uniref:Uncharacterized protein n=1 Tax=Tanacetum coccineum TaxID=301880 RepID=A0ABQ5GNB6_9ASTR